MKNHLLKKLWLATFFFSLVLVFSFSLWAKGEPEVKESYTGHVERIIDGDTVSILTTDYERLRVRLYGIDAPEGGQDWGDESRDALSDMVSGRLVKIEIEDIDRYNRMVATIIFNDELINHKMVAAGHAWVYDRYCIRKDICQPMKEAERIAKENGMGLWFDPEAMPPWEFRSSKRKK
ncbi:MAG: thermonuclease family protein [Deltaproteobacteria bacterium]|nr:thermonuclease family protein [Deltaproteobacteria bacterium]